MSSGSVRVVVALAFRSSHADQAARDLHPVGAQAAAGIGEDGMGHNWFHRFRRHPPPEPTLPEGWTDDLSVQVRPGRTIEELVDFILATDLARGLGTAEDFDHLVRALGNEFDLSIEDSELAIDRVQGGVVRARTGNEANRPDRAKNPIAWTSFERSRER